MLVDNEKVHWNSLLNCAKEKSCQFVKVSAKEKANDDCIVLKGKMQ